MLTYSAAWKTRNLVSVFLYKSTNAHLWSAYLGLCVCVCVCVYGKQVTI